MLSSIHSGRPWKWLGWWMGTSSPLWRLGRRLWWWWMWRRWLWWRGLRRRWMRRRRLRWLLVYTTNSTTSSYIIIHLQKSHHLSQFYLYFTHFMFLNFLESSHFLLIISDVILCYYIIHSFTNG